MKLYVFAAPYDYHKQAELVVMAETLDDAKKIAEKAKEKRLQNDYAWDRYFWKELVISDVEPEEESWYMNSGCDC